MHTERKIDTTHTYNQTFNRLIGSEKHPHLDSESNMPIYSSRQTCKVIPTPQYTHRSLPKHPHTCTHYHIACSHTNSYIFTVPMNRHTNTDYTHSHMFSLAHMHSH